jgi:hypothetical protein
MNCIPADVNMLKRFTATIQETTVQISGRDKMPSHTEGSNHDARTSNTTHTKTGSNPSGYFQVALDTVHHGRASTASPFIYHQSSFS